MSKRKKRFHLIGAHEVERLIDIIVTAVFCAISLGASAMIPSEQKIKSNEALKYKSQKTIISIMGAATLAGGIIILVLYISDSNYQQIVDLLYIIFLFVIGSTVIMRNKKKAGILKAHESTVMAMAAPAAPSVMTGAQVAPQTFPQAAPMQYPAAQSQPRPQVAVAQQYQTQQVAMPPPPPPPQYPATAQSPQRTVVSHQSQTPPGQYPATAQVTQRAVVTPQPATPVPQQVMASPAQIPRILTIKCPRCQGAMQIDTRMLGQKMRCPHCGIEGRIG